MDIQCIDLLRKRWCPFEGNVAGITVSNCPSVPEQHPLVEVSYILTAIIRSLAPLRPCTADTKHNVTVPHVIEVCIIRVARRFPEARRRASPQVDGVEHGHQDT